MAIFKRKNQKPAKGETTEDEGLSKMDKFMRRPGK